MNQQTRVLIIEDQAKIIHWLTTFLEDANMQVLSAQTGQQGLELARREAPDVVLLDLMLPDMDGLDVCRELRKLSDMFIIMLTARVEETDRLIGLEMGADDYVTKPFSPREVVARIRAQLRRASGALVVKDPLMTYGALCLDPVRQLCSVNGKPVLLTQTEFSILQSMMAQPGMLFTREKLVEEALGYKYAAYGRTVDAHIHNLRSKIEPDPHNPVYVVTVFGLGYRFGYEV